MLEHGANPQAVSLRGSTPLLMSCAYNHYDIAELVLDHGADIMKEYKNVTATVINSSPSILSLLKQRKGKFYFLKNKK